MLRDEANRRSLIEGVWYDWRDLQAGECVPLRNLRHGQPPCVVDDESSIPLKIRRTRPYARCL